MRTTPTSVSVATFIERNGKLLLVRQKPEKGGKWGPPAGHLELNESIIDAAKRETLEETGFEIKLLNLVGIYSLGDVQRRRITFVFRVEIIGGKGVPTGKETAELKWFTKEGVERLIVEDGLYKPEYNQKCLPDWLSGETYPLSILKEGS